MRTGFALVGAPPGSCGRGTLRFPLSSALEAAHGGRLGRTGRGKGLSGAYADPVRDFPFLRMTSRALGRPFRPCTSLTLPLCMCMRTPTRVQLRAGGCQGVQDLDPEVAQGPEQGRIRAAQTHVARGDRGCLPAKLAPSAIAFRDCNSMMCRGRRCMLR